MKRKLPIRRGNNTKRRGTKPTKACSIQHEKIRDEIDDIIYDPKNLGVQLNLIRICPLCNKEIITPKPSIEDQVYWILFGEMPRGGFYEWGKYLKEHDELRKKIDIDKFILRITGRHTDARQKVRVGSIYIEMTLKECRKYEKEQFLLGLY